MSLAEALVDLEELTRRLRRECPWDREQTALTIVPYTVEEAYEVADAVAAGNAVSQLDELGDLLSHVYFLALLLEEEGYGGLEDVARGIHEKLVRRHPHVFGIAEASNAGAVRLRWEEVKTEQEGRKGVFHHVAEALPALLLARKVQQRAASAGFEYPDVESRFEHLESELRELRAEVERAGEPAPETAPDARVADEIGDVLFLLVNAAMRLNVDPELALRGAARKFVSRVERAVEIARAEGVDWRTLDLEAQDDFYDRAKAEVG
jgi:MazG family protein